MKTYRLPEHGEFTVLNLTDLHLTGADWTADTGHLAIVKHTVSTLIERVHPDLITLTGDYSTEPYSIDLIRFGNLMETYGIDWAPVWGNHDNSGGEGLIDRVSDYYLTLPHCIYEKGEGDMGNGNYLITVHDGDRTCAVLFLMDSHRGSIWESQMKWFDLHARVLREEGCGSGAVLQHVPLIEFKDAMAAARGLDLSEVSREAIDQSCEKDHWQSGYEDSFGIMGEKICHTSPDPEWFSMLRESGVIDHVIAGHDHLNNFSISYGGLRLVYALKTGLGAYGRMPLCGGSVIRIGKEGIRGVSHEYVDVGGMPHIP